MILKINYYFQLSIIVVFAISNLVAINGIFLMLSLLYLGILHLVSFVLLMIHPLSRSGYVFSNWMIYLLGVFLVPLLGYAATFIGLETYKYFFVSICLLLGLFFLYNSYQLWKSREYDSV
jgi:hypothetical protein